MILNINLVPVKITKMSILKIKKYGFSIQDKYNLLYKFIQNHVDTLLFKSLKISK